MSRLLGATVCATNRTYGLAPSREPGPAETVVKVDPYDNTVETAEGNTYLSGDYTIHHFEEARA